MYETIFSLKKLTEEQKHTIRKVAADIELKDSTFKWRIEADTLNIYSETRDKAYRRGVLLNNKYDGFKGLGFNVYYVRN